MTDDTNTVYNEDLLESIEGISSQISSVSKDVSKLDQSVEYLTKDVARNADAYSQLSLEHNSLINRVNHIDMRISIMEETTRIQNKHNEEIHNEFRKGLTKLERSLDVLTTKLDTYAGETNSSVKQVIHTIAMHTIEEERWQKNIYKTGMIFGLTTLLAVIGFLGKWAFTILAG
jgi:chromosome segregation ATPase